MKEEENKKESKEERKESPGMEKEEEERNKVISLDAKPLQGSPCQSPLHQQSATIFKAPPPTSKMAAACYTLSGLFTRMFPPDLATVCV
jgi:hypothetical protein